MKVIEFEQGSPEWLRYRSSKIGASDLPVIMGSSPFKTKRKLFEEKITGESGPITPPMRKGLVLEKEALTKFNRTQKGLTGLAFSPVVIEGDKEWQMCSLDGAVFSNSHGGVHIGDAVEIKCPGLQAHLYALEKEVPPYYIHQLQWQMHVCKLSEMWYLSYFEGDFISFRVYADKNLQKEMEEKAEEFYKSLAEFIPPPEGPEDFAVVRNLDALAEAENYRRLVLEKNKITKDLEASKERLLALSQGKKCKIGDVAITSVFKQGTIDWERFSKEKGFAKDEVEAYRKSSTIMWRINV